MRQIRLARVDTTVALPGEMSLPESRTRWDLTGFSSQETLERTIDVEGKVLTVTDRYRASHVRSVESTEVAIYTDPSGGDAAARWILPDRTPEDLRPGTRRTLSLDLREGASVRHLRIEIETVGVGWVHLPTGPHESALQRAVVADEPDGRGAFGPAVTLYRWVDPLVGVVAETGGVSPAGAMVLEKAISGAADLRIYVDQLWRGTYSGLNYGWDPGVGVSLSALTAQHYATEADVASASSWDFSVTTAGTEVASTTTPVNSSETCNAARCGYNAPGAVLERTDKNFATAVAHNIDRTNDVAQREDRAGDVTIWIRAGAQHEGWWTGFSTPDPSSENRFCYTTDTTTRTPVPLWRFSHPDAATYYFTAGDVWQSGTFACEQNVYNQHCGTNNDIAFNTLYINACTTGGQTYAGRQGSKVVKGGVVTVPSGHTFNALLVRNVAEFCVWGTSSCSFLNFEQVRTVVDLWQVPYLGSVAMVQSPTDAGPADVNGNYPFFTTVDLSNIGFGLFPPRTITAPSATTSTVSLNWDPGQDTHRISGYKVYWDTDSGGSTPYAFDSDGHPGQVSFAGPSATVSGLLFGTPYYFTITSLSNFTDRDSGIATRYESLVYPTQVYGDPSNVYPIEVLKRTACPATSEVTGLVETNLGGGNVQLCWNALGDPGVVNYRVLGADSPTSEANFSLLSDVGLSTCWSGTPSQSYFVVYAMETGGNGCWGHYGH
ncbi:MAG: fibronectin type III domain-containing protein [Acidobacteriia bacterium]|nr:fibronectin type III domain-containing protein [Terriglobia bacterium]